MGFLAFLPSILEIIKQVLPNKEKQLEAEVEIKKVFLQAESQRLEAEARKSEAEANIVSSQASVIKAEVESDSWMAKNWRPCLMFVIMALIVYNWMIAPILQSVGLKLLLTPVPGDMWTLLTVSVGGYVVGKSGERMVGLYSDAKTSSAQANADAQVAKFDNERFYSVLRTKVFKQGLTQEQVEAINEALREGGNGK